MKRWERNLAHATHVGFYGLLLGLPLTGWLLVSTSRTVIPTLLYGAIPWPNLPGLAGLAGNSRHEVHEAAEFSHSALVYVAYLLLALHVAGALKHHFVERGGDLARMVPVRPQRLSLLLGVIAIGAAGALALGNMLPLGGARPTPVEAVPRSAPVAPQPVQSPQPSTPSVAHRDAVPVVENATAAVAKPTPAKWTVHRDASTLAFATSWAEGPVTGRFTRWDADILFDPDALDRSSVDARIDMTSATTGVTETESALPGEDWFAAATHPVATFTAKSFRKLGGDRYEARGNLRLRGVSRPVTLPFTLKIAGTEARMSGSTRIDRTSFGIGQRQWAATDNVPASVTITIKLTATRL